MTQINLYRALKAGTKDEYVIGCYSRHKLTNGKYRHFIQEDREYETALIYEIDPTTLSIHFQYMLDSQGNKIFASLSEDGKGGDILSTEDFDFVIIQHSRDYIHFVDGDRKAFTYAPKYFSCYNKRNYRIIGIKQ